VIRCATLKTIENKMKVEIWSDVMCPFCYIGKRKFEAALAQFEHKDNVEMVWHSFQLNPNLTYQPDKDVYDYVAELKGQTREWSLKAHKSLIESAKAVGLNYQLDKSKITNSFDAHRVIQLAKNYKLDDAIAERFFKAYFTEGALMSDHETLVRLAEEIGLHKDEVWSVLKSNLYADEVRKDGEEAQRIGATGVPFFVVNRKYAVSGAQNSDVFLQTLKKSFLEWRKENPDNTLEVLEGKV
jgi:predicted DsbA family dithiol-disulfide isomerase